MRWILLIGGCAISKLPCPGNDGALSRGRLIGELYVVRGAGECQVGAKLRCRVRVDRYIIRFTDGIGAAPVPGDEGNRIGARGTICGDRILQGRGLSVTKIPLPVKRCVGGKVFELYGQGAAASRCGSREVRDGRLSTGTKSKNTKAASNN